MGFALLLDRLIRTTSLILHQRIGSGWHSLPCLLLDNLNEATYGVTLAEILTDADGKKVSRSPSELAVFPETVSRLFVLEN